MIIDSHVHVSEHGTLDRNIEVKIADGTKTLTLPFLHSSLSVNRLLESMDEFHVDKALIMSFTGFSSNEFVSKVIKEHPKKFIGFAWVDNPNLPSSIRELEKAVTELGLKGLKLNPGVQAISPSNPEIFPLIRKATELNIPILIHTYPWPSGFIHHCLPEHIDILKSNVPNATIIVGHMGYHRFLDLLSIAELPGVYAETSWTLPMVAELFGIDFTTRFIRRLGADNVVFGSDWNGSNEELNKQLDLIEKMHLTREEKEKILGQNIRKVLEEF